MPHVEEQSFRIADKNRPISMSADANDYYPKQEDVREYEPHVLKDNLLRDQPQDDANAAVLWDAHSYSRNFPFLHNALQNEQHMDTALASSNKKRLSRN